MRVRAVAAGLVGLAVAACGGSAGGRADAGDDGGGGGGGVFVRPRTQDGPIARENENPGDPGWALAQPSWNHELEAYASTLSAAPGETVSIRASADGPHSMTWGLWRIGSYGGAGGRVVAKGGPLAVTRAQACPMDPDTGRVACRWPETFALALDPSWPGGLYLLRLTRDDGWDAAVPLVVRDGRASDVLVNIPLVTDAAYDNWGGASLYEDDVGTLQGHKAVKVSLDRPFQQEAGAGNVFAQAAWIVRWLEGAGYDATYSTGVDLDRDPGELARHALVVTAGHDEYWSRAYREGADAALARGTSFAFLGGNIGYWRIRLEDDRRTVVCYKAQAARDPLAGTPDQTTRFRDDPLSHPEDELVGVMYENWQLVNFPFVVSGASDALYAGTGLSDGDAILGLVGNEYDRSWPGSPATRVLGNSPVFGAEGTTSVANAVVRDTPGGGLVFGAGTIDWAWALPGAPMADARLTRLTMNVFDWALHFTPSDAPAPSAPPPPPLVPAFAPRVDVYAGTGTRGFADGPALGAQFDGPQGLTLGPDGALWVADKNNLRVRRIAPGGGQVDTVAGNGLWQTFDGPATQVGLGGPSGLAFGKDGALYIADSGAHCIRRLQAGMLNAWAGRCGGDGGYADGPGGVAQFLRPTGIAADGDGLVVADTGNAVIRRIAKDSTVTTIAGVPGNAGYADGPAGSAQFLDPSDLAPLPGGGFAILDAALFSVRTLVGGRVATLAGGMGEGLADGPALSAALRAQHGLVASGPSLYFADTGNLRVRVISNGGISTLAGSGKSGAASASGEATDFALPAGLALDGDVLYVSDAGTGTIRAIHLR